MHGHVSATAKVVPCCHIIQLDRGIVVDCARGQGEVSECSDDFLANDTEDLLYSMRKRYLRLAFFFFSFAVSSFC